MKIEMDKDFRGNAYIIQNEDVFLKFSGGFADLANEIPNTLNTRFGLFIVFVVLYFTTED